MHLAEKTEPKPPDLSFETNWYLSLTILFSKYQQKYIEVILSWNLFLNL
jgi:hypothetical protein